MPEIERRNPKRATVEDCDEDDQKPVYCSQPTANVSMRRSQQEASSRQKEQSFRTGGADSGYVSRAETVSTGSTSTSQRKKPGLRVHTGAVPERERQPYALSQAGPSKPPAHRQPSSHGSSSVADPRPAKSKNLVHERGSCWSCDYYGKHVDAKNGMSRVSSAAPPPPSPTTARQSALKGLKDDAVSPVKTRRPSLGRQSRPISLVSDQAVPSYYVNQALYGAVANASWGNPLTPTVPYSPVPYSYGPAPMTASLYNPLQPTASYFDPAASEPQSAEPSRRSSPSRRLSGYGDSMTRQGYPESPVTRLEPVTPRESRPVLSSHKSNYSTDHDRAMMPPPARPSQQSEVGLQRRPSTRRARTYHPEEVTPRQHSIYGSERYDEIYEDIDHREPRATLSTLHERRESTSRPPTSYRAAPVVVESRGRPPMPRKSATCSTPLGLPKVESSRPHNQARDFTLPSTPLEDKEKVAEEYLKRSNKTSYELTAEALRKLSLSNSASRSETGSSYSHKSRQSSSKDSSGPGKSQATNTRKTSITLSNGLNMSIPSDYMAKDGPPISIKVGDMVVSVGVWEGHFPDRPKEQQRRIERAPSVTSRASKKSASSGISNRERDAPPQPTRRLSQLEEQGFSVRSSRQPSRAPSISGRAYEYSRRQSVDAVKPYEEVMYGA